MDNDNYILLTEICDRYEVEISFIRGLEESGLVRVVQREGSDWLDCEELADLERMIRLHNELDINLAGLEAIHHLLLKVREMQQEIRLLKSRLGDD